MTHAQALFDVLGRLKEMHRELYRLAMEKKDVLIHNDIDALQRITRQEQKWIKQVEEAEAERAAIVQSILKERGITLGEPTLSDLVQTVTDPAHKQKLQQEREELLGIVSELRQANQLNQQLLEQSLSFVQMSLDLLTGSPEDDYFYRNPSSQTASSQVSRPFFNHKA